MKICAPFALLIASLFLLPSATPSQEQKGSSVTLDIFDMKKTDDLPMVTISVNGTKGLFLIDTGQVAEGTTLTPSFARRCGITQQEPTVTITIGEGSGAIELKNFDAFVYNRKIEKDGILGANFFERVRTTMDYPADKVTFTTYDRPEKYPADAKRAPIEFLKTKTRPIKGPYAKITIDGSAEQWVCFDTGANWSSINTDSFDAIFKTPFKETIFGVSYTVGNGRLKTGEIEIPDAKFVRLTNQGLIMTRNFTGTSVVGLVGTNIMKHYIVTFDYDKKEMIFAPPSKR